MLQPLNIKGISPWMTRKDVVQSLGHPEGSTDSAIWTYPSHLIVFGRDGTVDSVAGTELAVAAVCAVKSGDHSSKLQAVLGRPSLRETRRADGVQVWWYAGSPVIEACFDQEDLLKFIVLQKYLAPLAGATETP